MKTKDPIEKLCDELIEEDKLETVSLLDLIIVPLAVGLDCIKMATKYILEKIKCKKRKRKTKKQK